jgi:hypothetical protein
MHVERYKQEFHFPRATFLNRTQANHMNPKEYRKTKSKAHEP